MLDRPPSAIDLVDEDVFLQPLPQRRVEPVKELLEGFAGAPHQSYEHLVTVGRSGSTVNRPYPSERDIAVSPDEEVEILPAPASRAGTVIASNTASRPLLCHLSV